MELTKFCVELVWILNFGFIPTFGLIFGIDCRMVLCCVFAMFCGLNWEDIVASGQGLFQDGFESKWRVSELPRSSLARCCVEATLLCGWAQN